MCQNLFVPALDAGSQKDRPYQSGFYRAGFNAIPRQAREQDSFDTPPYEFYKNLTLVNFLDLEGMLEEMVREVTSHHMEHILFARIEHKVFLCLLNPSNIVF